MVIERHPTWSVAQVPRLSCVSLKGLVDNAERGSFILSCNICLRPSSDRTGGYQFIFTKLHYTTNNDTVSSVLAIGQVNSTIFDLKWGWIVRWLQYMTTIRHRGEGWVEGLASVTPWWRKAFITCGIVVAQVIGNWTQSNLQGPHSSHRLPPSMPAGRLPSV